MRESEVALPLDASAPSRARAFARTWLLEHDLEQLLDTVLLLTSEVVTNALLHAGGAVRIALVPMPGGGVRVEVCDDSPVQPTRRRHSTSATTGRGLRLLDDLAGDWGTDPTPPGKAVWFTVAADADPWAAFSGTDWMAEAE